MVTNFEQRFEKNLLENPPPISKTLYLCLHEEFHLAHKLLSSAAMGGRPNELGKIAAPTLLVLEEFL